MPNLLEEISPAAAKIYLALSTLTRPNQDPPLVQISLEALSHLTTMSERSCTHALRELFSLKLIARHPAPYHTARIYEILPFPYSQPAATLQQVNSQPAATLPPAHSQPVATLPPSDSQPAASLHRTTPNNAPKTPNSQPAATHTNLSLTPTEEALLTDPTFLQLLMSTLTPTQNAHLLATAQSTLAGTPAASPEATP